MEGHSIARTEVTLLRHFGTETHFEGKIHGFTRFLQILQQLFQKISVPAALLDGFSMWMWMYTLSVD